MLYVDLKYISLVSPHLRNFKQKNRTLFNFSCPVCGDSERKKSKARGFFYQHGNTMIYKCHNCSAGMGVANFLKSCFPTYYDEYIFERYKSGVENSQPKISVAKMVKVPLHTFKSSHAQKISELDDTHYAKQYVKQRQLPESVYSKLYFTQDFDRLVDDIFPQKYTNLAKNESRLVIPFFDKDNKILGLQGRSFSAEKALRYITIRASNNINLIYGLDRLDTNKTVYVVEGPLDSLFIPNGIAAANSDLASASKKIPNNPNTILVYDNEPKNKEIVKLMEDSIRSGHSVCIWPHEIKQKDINEIILSGLSQQQLLDVINQNAMSGLRAELEFSKWKKV